MFSIYPGIMDCWPFGDIVCQAQVGSQLIIVIHDSWILRICRGKNEEKKFENSTIVFCDEIIEVGKKLPVKDYPLISHNNLEKKTTREKNHILLKQFSFNFIQKYVFSKESQLKNRKEKQCSFVWCCNYTCVSMYLDARYVFFNSILLLRLFCSVLWISISASSLCRWELIDTSV